MLDWAALRLNGMLLCIFVHVTAPALLLMLLLTFLCHACTNMQCVLTLQGENAASESPQGFQEARAAQWRSLTGRI